MSRSRRFQAPDKTVDTAFRTGKRAKVPETEPDPHGARLEAARSSDRQWRAQRESELRKKLEITQHLDTEANLTFRFACTTLGASIATAFTGLFLMLAFSSPFFALLILVGAIGVLVALMALLVGMGTRIEEMGRRAVLRAYGRRNAIEIVDASEVDMKETAD